MDCTLESRRRHRRSNRGDPSIFQVNRQSISRRGYSVFLFPSFARGKTAVRVGPACRGQAGPPFSDGRNAHQAPAESLAEACHAKQGVRGMAREKGKQSAGVPCEAGRPGHGARKGKAVSRGVPCEAGRPGHGARKGKTVSRGVPCEAGAAGAWRVKRESGQQRRAMRSRAVGAWRVKRESCGQGCVKRGRSGSAPLAGARPGK